MWVGPIGRPPRQAPAPPTNLIISGAHNVRGIPFYDANISWIVATEINIEK